jgi:predicted RNase H-like nuclease (RuvC/YqgF family)
MKMAQYWEAQENRWHDKYVEAEGRVDQLETKVWEQASRIETLEAALNNCVNVLTCFERPDFYQIERTSPIKPYALGALDVARAALEGKKNV